MAPKAPWASVMSDPSAQDDEGSADHLKAMTQMSADELKIKIDVAKSKENLEIEAVKADLAARVKAIEDSIAAGKAAFAAGNYHEADRQFEKALTENPERKSRVEIICNRSACALKLGRYQDAVSDAAEVTCMEPTFVKGFYRLALAQQGLGKIERALSACRQALELQPESAQLLKLLAELEKACPEHSSAPTPPPPPPPPPTSSQVHQREGASTEVRPGVHVPMTRTKETLAEGLLRNRVEHEADGHHHAK